MKHVASLGFTVAVAIVACGGTSGDEPPTAFGTTVCDLVRSQCCVQPSSSDADCTHIVGKLGTGDSAVLDACLAELRAAQKAVSFCDRPMHHAPSCLLAFSPKNAGSRALGDECNTSGDCAPSTDGPVGCETVLGGGGKPRICSLMARGRAGDGPCLRTTGPLGPEEGRVVARGFVCDANEGLYCDSTTQKCAAAKAEGAACLGSRYECTAAGTCTADKCAPRLPKGASCGDPIVDPCQHGHKCVAGTCVELRPVGAPCGVSQECKSTICNNGTCSRTASNDYLLTSACVVSRQ